MICSLCERTIPDEFMEKHHLIPKAKKGQETIDVCNACGDQIHVLFTNKELSKKYNTIDSLQNHPSMIKYISWIQKRPTTFRICSATKKRR